jgi:hypothetical protein
MTLKFTTALLVAAVAAGPLWAQGSQFVPVTPCRVVDTRNANSPFGGPIMTPGSTRSFAIPQSACNIPATAQAYALNVTVVPEGPLGYLSLWPTGQTQPSVSTLNSPVGAVVANAAIVPAGTGGAVSVFVTDSTEVIIDINGYFATGGSAASYSFYPATPCRIADTRNATGMFGGPTMQAGQSRAFPVPQSNCEIPSSAQAYSVNVTVAPGGPLGYLTLWPTGQTQPGVSTLNSEAGSVVANAALVPAGNNEAVSVFVTNPTDVILDINGYFGQPGSPNALAFYPVTPCRVVDTRNAPGAFGGPIMSAGQTRSFVVPSSNCNIPTNAAAYSLNATVVPDGPLYYLTAWPTGASQPVVSTLNSDGGAVAANAAIVPAGTGGAIDIFVTGPTHVILDINGYFAPGTPAGGSAVAERALAQTGLSIGLASIVLQSQVEVIFAAGTQASACNVLDGGGSVNSGLTPTVTDPDGNPVYPVTVYYDNICSQPYITGDITALAQGGDDSGLITETATYYSPNGTKLGAMALNETLSVSGLATGSADIQVNGLGLFTPASGAQTPVQLGLACKISGGSTAVPCEGAVAQDFPGLNLAIGAVTSLTLHISEDSSGDASSVSFTGGGSAVTGPLGSLTLTNPSPSSFVIQGGTPYTTTTASGGAAEFALFPPAPTAWTLADPAHDQQLQISLIDDITRDLSITITQISTGKTLVTGTLNQSGTGSITYSDGTTAAITNWALAD